MQNGSQIVEAITSLDANSWGWRRRDPSLYAAAWVHQRSVDISAWGDEAHDQSRGLDLSGPHEFVATYGALRRLVALRRLTDSGP